VLRFSAADWSIKPQLSLGLTTSDDHAEFTTECAFQQDLELTSLLLRLWPKTETVHIPFILLLEVTGTGALHLLRNPLGALECNPGSYLPG
jgi:hypothetical protein